MANYINLSIGEMYLDIEPTVVSTILGSCVSVSLFSEKSNAGGIIHFALPDRSYATNSNRNDLNFGDSAIIRLFEELLQITGNNNHDFVAKIVGGANVVNELAHATSIGDLNIEIARDTLKKLGIKVIGEHVGGTAGRKVFFYTDTGRLRVSPIESSKTKKIRVLMIDNSKEVRDLVKILESNEIEVVGIAKNASEAESLIEELLPDVVTLDILMPGMNGPHFLQKNLPRYPIPIVMISSVSIGESDQILKALEMGAVDYIQKPSAAELLGQAKYIREKIIIASSIKVSKKSHVERKSIELIKYKGIKNLEKVVAIGASTGGTLAIKEVLLGLPRNIPPIVIVQHIPHTFSTAFTKSINDLCPFEVIEGADNDEVRPGRVIIAPGGRQMEIILVDGKPRVRVFDGEKVNRHRPSVDVLFDSVAKLVGKESIGVILTGMGNDGAAGLLKMRTAGAYTIGQDESSSTVYGMPKEAYLLNAVVQVCSLKSVAQEIIRILES